MLDRFLDFHVMNLTGFRDIFSLMFFFNETESIISELRYLWMFTSQSDFAEHKHVLKRKEFFSSHFYIQCLNMFSFQSMVRCDKSGLDSRASAAHKPQIKTRQFFF